MSPFQVFFFVFLALATFSTVESANIFFFHVVATPSHRSSIWPLVAGLADAGHNVTYSFPLYRRVGSHPKVKEFFASKMIAEVDSYNQYLEINHRLNHTLEQAMLHTYWKVPDFCAAFYDSPETKEMLTQEGVHYDLILIDGTFIHCAYGLVHHFKAKQIVFNPVLPPYLYDPFGVVPESSSIPGFMFHLTVSDLVTSLWSRTLNVLEGFLFSAVFVYSAGNIETVIRDRMKVYERSGGTMPSFEEFVQDTSLMFYNSYFVEDYPVSLPPMFVSYSGLSCSKKERSSRKPLPVEMEAFINDTDTSGFVYISFGSAVHVHEMPGELKNQFMAAFQAFPNLRFLMKWNGTVPEDAPKNVLFQSWFPQLDILAHPKIKAFMTQAGLPSVQEALCYAVPLIGVPIFGDQVRNTQRAVEIGVAIQLDIESLSSDTMISAIRQTTEAESKFKIAAIQRSAQFRDRPVDPLENALYWVEYVLKYNTTLLKPLGMKQHWWQRRLLDVYALLTAIFFSISFFLLFVGYQVIQITVRRCTASNGKPSTLSRKKKD